MTTWGNYIQKEVEVQHNLVEQHEEFIKGRVIDVQYEVKENFESKLQWLSKDVVFLKKEILQGASIAIDVPSKVKVIEPKGFSGTQNAEKLKKLLIGHREVLQGRSSPRNRDGVDD